MPRIGTHVVGSFFLSALLPPRDETETGFYEILGLESNTTDVELRKAYRKLSLKLHPDKIAQRGGDSAKKEEAAAEYERIQEAYHVLIDEKKKLKYDALGTPSRFRFVEKGGFADPQSVYDNLTSSALSDRSRLVGLYFLAILLLLMQPILIGAKINQVLEGGPLQNSSWFAILIPFWFIGGFFIVLTFVAAFFVSSRDWIPICILGFEHTFWYLGTFFLCYKWDGSWDDLIPYRQALVPIYIAMVLRWFRSAMILQNVRHDVNRMVTSDYIEKEFLKGRSMDDLPDDEQEELAKVFLVVSVDPEFVPFTEDLTEEELEELKIESSPEYLAATEIYNNTFNGLACSIVFGIIFLILLTLKLDGRLNGASWWAVFSPFWIERGGRLVYNLYKWCCGGISGDEVVILTGSDYTGDIVAGSGNDEADSGSKNEKFEDESPTKEDGPKAPSSEINTGDDSQTKTASPDTNEKIDEEAGKSETLPGNSINNTNHLASTEKIAEKKDEPGEASPADKNNDDNDGKDDKDDGEDGSEGIPIDEDTFNAYQSAFNEVEKDAKRERAQACSESCRLIFHIIMLSLVVAKIEKNFDSVDPNDAGFNVFWILFPFFLFFGCTCCCCAMIIFGASPEVAEGFETDEAGHDPENPPINTDEDPIIPVVAATEEEPDAVEVAIPPETQTTTESAPEKPSVSDPPPDGDMDDLD